MSYTRLDEREAEPAALDDATDRGGAQPSGEQLALQGAAALRRIGGQKYQRGQASYYGTSTRAQMHAQHRGDGFIGQKQANGTPLDPHAMTAAHKTLPLGTKIGVYAIETGKECVVEITDRGPYEPGRILDGTVAVAKALGYEDEGHTEVELLTSPHEMGSAKQA